MWIIFKVFIKFVTILAFYVLILGVVFMFLSFWRRSMWDLSSLTRDGTHTPCTGRRNVNHWATRDIHCYYLLISRF